MHVDLVTRFEEALKGCRCTIQRGENVWIFDFGDGCRITAESPWRLVVSTGIAFADTDDGQQFGLSAPVDGEAVSNALLKGHKIKSATVDRVTADLRLV